MLRLASGSPAGAQPVSPVMPTVMRVGDSTLSKELRGIQPVVTPWSARIDARSAKVTVNPASLMA